MTDSMKNQVPSQTLKHLRQAVLRWGDLVPPTQRSPEMAIIKGFLPIDPLGFANVAREKQNGRMVPNRCLRDALWFVLRYYYPKLFKSDGGNPQFVEKARLFGAKVPDWLPIAGGAQFSKIQEALAAFRIKIIINGKETRSNGAVVRKLLGRFINPFGISFEKMIVLIKESLAQAEPCVVFAPVGNLMDHALFTYGLSDRDLHCLDTHKVEELPYWNVSGEPDRFIMEFPLEELKNCWNFLGMVWCFPLMEVSKE